MKHKKIFSFLVTLLMVVTLFVFVQSNNLVMQQDKDDLNREQYSTKLNTEITPYGYEWAGNLLSNPKIRYSSTDTQIPNWKLQSTANIYGGLKDSSITSSVSDGFRAISPNESRFAISASNNSENSHFKSKVMGNGASTSFLSLAQNINITRNQKYIILLDRAGGGTRSDGTLFVFKNHNITSGNNPTYQTINFWNTSTNRTSYTNEFTADTTGASFVLRHVQNESEESVLSIFYLGIFRYDDYQLQASTRDLFEQDGAQRLKYDDFSSLQSKITAIETRIANERSKFSASVITQVEATLVVAKNQLVKMRALNDKVDNLYQDKANGILIDNLEQSQIDNILDEINTYQSSSFTQNFKDRLQIIQNIHDFDNSKKLKISDFRTKIDHAKNLINDLEYLTTDRKATLASQMDTLLEDAERDMNAATNHALLELEVTKYEDILNDRLIEIDLENEKAYAKLQIDNESEKLENQIQDLTSLTADEKANYISQLNATKQQGIDNVLSQTTSAGVKTKQAEGIKKVLDVFLLAYQVNAKHELETYANERKDLIDQMASLTVAQKDNYKLSIDDELATASQAIELTDTTDSVQTIKVDAKAHFFDQSLDASKVNAHQAIDNYLVTKGLDPLPAALGTILDPIKTSIDTATALANVEAHTNEALFEIDLYLAKQVAIQALDQRLDETKIEISGLSNLLPNRVTHYQDLADDIVVTPKQQINDARTLAAIDHAKNQGLETLNENLLNAHKENYKNMIQDLYQDSFDQIENDNYLTTGENGQKETFKADLLTLVNRIKTELDEKTTKAYLDARYIQGEIEINDFNWTWKRQSKVNQIAEEKAQLIDQINNLADVPESDKTDAISVLNSHEQKLKDEVDHYNTTEGLDDLYTRTYNDMHRVLDNLISYNEQVLEDVQTNFTENLNIAAAEIIDSINKAQHLTAAEKQSFITAVENIKTTGNQAILDATTTEEVRTYYTSSLALMQSELNKALVLNEQTLSKNVLLAKRDELNLNVDEFKYLTVAEKLNYTDQLNQAYTDLEGQVDMLDKVLDVRDKKIEGIALLESIYLNAYKTENQKALDKSYEDAKNKINDNENLSAQDKEDSLNDLENTYDDSQTNISDATDTDKIDDILKDAQKQMDDIVDQSQKDGATNLNDKKDEFKNKLNQKAFDTVSLINSLENLTAAERKEFSDQVEALRQEGTGKIHNQKTVADAEVVQNDYILQMDEVYLNALKLSAKRKIENHVKSLTDEGMSADAGKSILDHFNKIDQETDKDKLDDLVEDAIFEIEELILLEYAAKKVEVEQKLKDYAKNPEDEVVKQIIKDQVDKVTTKNYEQLDVIEEIINEGKDLIDAYYNNLVDTKKNEVNEELNIFVGDYHTPEMDTIIQDFIDQITKDNFDNVSDMDTLVKDAKDELSKLILDNSKTIHKDLIDNYLKDAYGDNVPKDLQDTINDLKDAIDQGTTLKEVDDKYKDTIGKIDDSLQSDYQNKVEEFKEKLKEHAGDNYPIVEDMIDDLLKDIDDSNYKNTTYMDELLNDGKQTIDEKIFDTLSEGLLEKLKNSYQSHINSDDYAAHGLINLADIYNKALDNLGSISDLESMSDRVDKAIKDFETVGIRRIKNIDFNLLDPNLKRSSPELMYVAIENEDGMSRTTRVTIKALDIDLSFVSATQRHLTSGRVSLPINFSHTIEESKNLIEHHKLSDVIDIKLLDDNGLVITDFEGTYKVTYLLPEHMKASLDIQVVYVGDDHVEVFNVIKHGKWISFETTHFSTFYIYEYEVKTASTLEANAPFLVIFLLLLVILFQIVAIVIKRHANQLKLRSVVWPMLIILWSQATIDTIIGVLVGIVIILTIYLIYLFLTAQRVKREYNITVHNDTHVTNATKEPVFMQQPEIVAEPEVVIEPESDVMVEVPKIIYNYSFQARMHQAPKESQERYSEIKNHVLSYDGVKLSNSWKYERFIYKGKTVFKAWIHGNRLKLYYNLDPLLLQDTKYNIENVSKIKKHATTPSLMNVSGNRTTNYALELIDMYLADKTTKLDQKPKDYTVKYIKRDKLVEMGLVKINKNYMATDD